MHIRDLVDPRISYEFNPTLRRWRAWYEQQLLADIPADDEDATARLVELAHELSPATGRRRGGPHDR